MYRTTGSNNYTSTHTNTNDSEIKTSIDTCYKNNLLGYEDYLICAGLCNDKSVASSNKGNRTRPVINLKSTVEISSGNGTSSNPYVIKTN